MTHWLVTLTTGNSYGQQIYLDTLRN